MARLNFNVHDIPDEGNRNEPVPQGTYDVRIIETGTASPKSGSGEWLTIKV